MKDDICCSTSTKIPTNGQVFCPCGIIWTDHDEDGNPQFEVPFHDKRGYRKTAVKVREALDRWLTVHLRKLEVKREREREEAKRAWEARIRTLTTRTPGMKTDMKMGGTIRGRPG